MLRSWAVSLTVLLGVGLSVALAQPLPSSPEWVQGEKYLTEGRTEEAKRLFENLLEKHPNEPDLHLFLALASLRLRDPKAAEAHAKKALAIAPDHVEALTLLGWVYLEVSGDYDAAIKEYAKVVRLRPDLPEAHNNLGAAFKKKGDLAKAVESFGRALKLKPDYIEALSNRGWVYLEEKKWSAARRDFARALEIDPAHEGALHGLSRVLKETRDYAGADRALRRLIGRSSNFVYWLEWGQLQLVRYYWLLLLAALAIFLYNRYKKGKKSYGG